MCVQAAHAQELKSQRDARFALTTSRLTRRRRQQQHQPASQQASKSASQVRFAPSRRRSRLRVCVLSLWTCLACMLDVPHVATTATTKKMTTTTTKNALSKQDNVLAQSPVQGHVCASLQGGSSRRSISSSSSKSSSGSSIFNRVTCFEPDEP